MKSPALAASPFLAALAWTVALLIDGGPYQPTAVFLVGLGLIVSAVISMVGMVVAAGRWAHRQAMAVVTAAFVLALARPIDGWWIAALLITTIAAAALFMPALTSGIRKLPAATGPPARSIIAPLILVGVPYFLGVLSYDVVGWPVSLVGISAPIVALAYSRVMPGGLILLRVIWPVLAVALALPMGWSRGLVSAFLGVTVALVAWDQSVKTAFHPPYETGSAYPIPPELAPREILDAADLDDRGRPR